MSGIVDRLAHVRDCASSRRVRRKRCGHDAGQAARADALIRDPLAAELLAKLDYPFAEHFGKPDLSHVLRALQFDGAVTAFLRDHPHGTVIALGEGLETEFWRVDNGTARWWTVDLPAIVELRGQLLPSAERATPFAGDAFDLAWTDALGEPGDVLILAQGLFMYFTEDRGSPAGGWCSTRSPAGPRPSAATGRAVLYRMPPQPWGVGRGALARIRDWHPRIADVRVLAVPRGRGFGWGVLYPFLATTPGLRALVPMTVALGFD